MVRVKVNRNDKIEYKKIYMFGVDKFLLPSLYSADGSNIIYKLFGEKRIEYLSTPAFLDCETSHNHDEDNPITWVYQWALEYNNLLIGGRKPSQLIKLLKKFMSKYKLSDTRKMILYVHNLSYDISFLWEYLKEAFENVSIMAMKKHKILQFTAGPFIFKCSYMLSNRSLEQWAKYTNSPVHKAEGVIDYDVIRYQDVTQLNYFDWYYQVNDVLTMKYAYNNMLAMFNDNVVTIPLTNTGYIRRDLRKASKKDRQNRINFEHAKMSVFIYKALLMEFAGGLVGGNMNYCGETIVADNIQCNDYKSDYPARVLLEDMPLGQFEHIFKMKKGSKKFTFDMIDKLTTKYCVLVNIAFKDLRLKKHVTFPYIQRYKCEQGKIGSIKFTDYVQGVEMVGDHNGKVCNMYGTTSLWVTEHDLAIIRKQYDFKSLILDVCISEKGRLPAFMIDTVMQYFYIKENAEGTERDKSKNNLNASYGCCAMKPVREEFNYNFDFHKWDDTQRFDDEAITKALDKYFDGKNNFMLFQWGCWITSTARALIINQIEGLSNEKHENGISKGYDKAIYSDTDSIYFFTDEEAEANIEAFNKSVIARCKKLGAYVPNIDGGISYIGTFEKEEKKAIKKFRFLHSKCYAYESADGSLHTTIAGVPKQTRINTKVKGLCEEEVIEYLTSADELGSIDNLDNHFEFIVNGGTSAEYIEEAPTISIVNGHKIEHAGGCIIKKTTKTLNDLSYDEPYVMFEYDDIETEVVKGVYI